MATAECDSEAYVRHVVQEYGVYYRFDRKLSSLGYLTPTQYARLGRLRSDSG